MDPRTVGRAAALALLVNVLVGTAAAQAATVSLFAAPVATGAGDCSTAADACTIVAAVTSANAQSTSDSVRITMADGTYDVSATTPTALAVTFTGPSLTLAAAPGAEPVLDGGSATQLLTIAVGSTVVVQGVDFRRASGQGPQGGAIENAGTLTVQDATFSDNTAPNGGAIRNEAGSVTTVRDSTFAGNVASAVGGGAMVVLGTTIVTRSAFLGNTGDEGGAINVQTAANLTLSRSTLSGNEGDFGGTIVNLGTIAVQGSTFVANQGTGSSVLFSSNSNVTFAANLIGPQAAGRACYPGNSAVTDAGYNLDTDGTCISATTPATGSHNGTTAYGASTYGQVLQAYLAGAPANNGGPTQTIALRNTPIPATPLADPAFDVVPPAFTLPVAIDGETRACATADQRGVTPMAGANCAIGAYLLQATSTSLAPAAPSVTPGSPVTWVATVTPSTATGGTVAFDDGVGGLATTQCPAQPLTGATATCTVTYPTTGTWTATAAYSGDGTQNDFAPSTSATAGVTVATAPPPTPPVPPAPPAPPVPPAPPTSSPSSSPIAPVVPSLTLSDVALTPRCLAPSVSAARLSYRLSRAAKVTFTVQRRRVPPRAPRARCRTPRRTTSPAVYVLPDSPTGDGSSYATVTQTRRTSHGPTRFALTRTLAATAGRHRLWLPRTLRADRRLAPGRYRVVVQAVAADGARSAIATVPFWVLERR